MFQVLRQLSGCDNLRVDVLQLSAGGVIPNCLVVVASTAEDVAVIAMGLRVAVIWLDAGGLRLLYSCRVSAVELIRTSDISL